MCVGGGGVVVVTGPLDFRGARGQQVLLRTESCGWCAVTGQRPNRAKHNPHQWYQRRLSVWTKMGNEGKTSSSGRRTAAVDPPSLVQATVNEPNLTEPTPPICSDKGVAYARRCGRCAWKDTVYCSEDQGAEWATNAITAQSASLTQHMTILHPKASASRSTQKTPQDQWKNTPPKPQKNQKNRCKNRRNQHLVPRVARTCCCPTASMAVALRNGSGHSHSALS